MNYNDIKSEALGQQGTIVRLRYVGNTAGGGVSDKEWGVVVIKREGKTDLSAFWGRYETGLTGKLHRTIDTDDTRAGLRVLVALTNAKLAKGYEMIDCAGEDASLLLRWDSSSTNYGGQLIVGHHGERVSDNVPNRPVGTRCAIPTPTPPPVPSLGRRIRLRNKE